MEYPVEVYFFHHIQDIVKIKGYQKYLHWSTYSVAKRNYVILNGFSLKVSETTVPLKETL